MFGILKKYKIESLLALSVLAFITYFSLVSINRYLTFRSNYFDLGIMDQVVYNTSRGRILEMTNQDLYTNASRFAIHFDPLLAFFAPIYVVFADPSVLLVAQVIVIGIGAIAVYLIAEKNLKNKVYALMFALSYLFYYPNQRAVIFDVHAVVFATTFLLFAVYFSLIKKYRIMLLFVFLSLLTKEHIGLITFLFGLYMLVKQKERRYSFVVMAVSLLFFVATFFYIIPHARQSSHFALKYLEDVGDSPKSIMINLVKNPKLLWSRLTTDEALNYLHSLFTSHLVFIIFAPLEFFISLPELAINLISGNSNMRAIYFHYNAAIVPFIYFSSIMGFARMQKFIKSKRLQSAFILTFIFSNVFIIYKYAPLPFKFLREPYEIQPINTDKMSEIQTWQKRLADESIPVATTPQIAPFFTHRKYFYNFLYDTGFMGAGLSEDDIIKDMDIYRKAEYIVIAVSEVDSEGSLEQKFYKNLKENADYEIIYSTGGIQVYKR